MYNFAELLPELLTKCLSCFLELSKYVKKFWEVMFEIKSKKKFLWMQLQCFSVGFSLLFSCFKLHDNLQEYLFATDGKNSWKEILMGNWKRWKKPGRKFWWEIEKGEKKLEGNFDGNLPKGKENKKGKRWRFSRWKKKDGNLFPLMGIFWVWPTVSAARIKNYL